MHNEAKKVTDKNAPKATRKQRALLADFCSVWRKQLSGEECESTEKPATRRASPEQGVSSELIPQGLSPRQHQTLELLLSGDGEKQIAAKMKISPHTVHGYVKSVYRRFDVSSRAELLALWVRK